MLAATVLVAIAVYVSGRIHSSRFGLSLTAIKQNEAAAEGAGVDAAACKLRAILVSGAIAAAAGGYYAATVPDLFPGIGTKTGSIEFTGNSGNIVVLVLRTIKNSLGSVPAN